MKSGFAHFDTSHRENFCAALLLLTMEVDDGVKQVLTGLVRTELHIEATSLLLGFGREARLGTSLDGKYARVDLWFLFDSSAGPFFAFIEVKTHNEWDPEKVAGQVQDQTERHVTARSERRVHGCLLLAPERLCRLVRAKNANIHTVSWPNLLARLRGLPSNSITTKHAIQHLEQQMDHSPGLDRSLALKQFEEATTIIACLRQFLVNCVEDIDGNVHGDPLFLTPGDGRPRRGGDWAWHGLSVPFTHGGKRGRVGIYKYAEAPPGQAAALETLWLELYLGDTSEPTALVEFAPPTLAGEHLDAARAELRQKWTQATERAAEADRPSGTDGDRGMIEERLISIRDPRLTKLTKIGMGEGFVTYTGELDGRPAFIADCGTLADMLSDEDAIQAPVTVHVFPEPSALQHYVDELRKTKPAALGT
jgi:hypothetical protein